MGQVSLQATMAYAYAGVSLNAGDQFLASEKDAHLLKAVGRAIDAPVLRTRAMEPAPDQSISSDDSTVEATRPKRQYRRRDMTAEP